jgi:hypothetical protein
MTKDPQKATELDLKTDKDPQFIYWLLVFPDLISGDPKIVEPAWVGMTLLKAETMVNKNLHSMAIHWQTAKCFGGYRIVDSNAKANVKKLFC